jgi:hypothetical protein
MRCPPWLSMCAQIFEQRIIGDEYSSKAFSSHQRSVIWMSIVFTLHRTHSPASNAKHVENFLQI